MVEVSSWAMVNSGADVLRRIIKISVWTNSRSVVPKYGEGSHTSSIMG